MPNTYRRKFSARAEVLVRSSSFKTVAHYNGFTSSTSDIVHTFNQLNTAITLAFDYRIFTVKKTRFFLGGGFRFNLPSYSNNVIYPSSYAPNGFAFGSRYYSFSIRTGFQFSKRMECLIEYNFNSTRLSDLNYVFLWDLSMSGPKIGLNYFINPK